MAGLDAIGAHIERVAAERVARRELVLRPWAVRLQGQAERAHPWTNRTGAAEMGLTGALRVTRGATRTRFDLGLGTRQPSGYQRRRSEKIFHGFYLEVAHGARWAVIRPTLDREWPAIRQAVRSV